MYKKYEDFYEPIRHKGTKGKLTKNRKESTFQNKKFLWFVNKKLSHLILIR